MHYFASIHIIKLIEKAKANSSSFEMKYYIIIKKCFEF